MKKKVLILALMLAFVICIFAISASAVKVDDIYYSLSKSESGNTAQVTYENVFCELEIVVIPETITVDGVVYTVTSLSGNAFSGVDSRELGTTKWQGNQTIKEVYIPKTVSSIGSHCFRECHNLEKVVILGTAKSFDDAVFHNCPSLKEIDMSGMTSESVTIGQYFCNSSALTTLKFPPTLTKISGTSCLNCPSLTSVELPESLTYLGDCVFQNCKNIESIKLPTRLEYFGCNNFQSNKKLTEMIIPGTVRTITKDIFHGSTVKTLIFATTNVTSFSSSFLSGNSSSVTLIFFPGTEDEAKTMFARDNRTKGWTNYVDYANYDSTQTYTNTIVYNTDLCSNCYDFAPELEVVAKDIVDAINEEAICESCGHGTSTKLFDAPIKYLGFSKKIGDNGSICIGYEVNDAALTKYEELTDKTYTYGVVAYIPEKGEDLTTLKPINDDLTLKDKNYTIQAETMGFASFEFIIKGFNTDAEKAIMLVMSAYVSDGTSVSYLGINQETNTISQTEFATLVSYNGFVEV